MTRNWLARERGAVLVHVAVAMLGFLGFSALVIDYGIMWSSRRQAQNAADAAALAAAISMAFDAPGDYDRARATAKRVGETHKIFGLAPTIDQGSGSNADITQDISFPPCPPGTPGPTDTLRPRERLSRRGQRRAADLFRERARRLLAGGQGDGDGADRRGEFGRVPAAVCRHRSLGRQLRPDAGRRLLQGRRQDGHPGLVAQRRLRADVAPGDRLYNAPYTDSWTAIPPTAWPAPTALRSQPTTASS